MVNIDVSAIAGITADSRQVKSGFLFAALEGAQHDGNAYIDAAIAAGAVYILTQYERAVPDHVTLMVSDNPRRDFAKLVAAFFGGTAAQPDCIVAVTGTNGKSSVVSFLEQIWLAQGLNARSLGTINSKLTSLDPVGLHEKLKALRAEGVTHLALEASSHGLDQYRMDGVAFRAAGFTNLSRDHLDYHDTMDDYLAAKKRLFAQCIASSGVAVLNADVPEYEILRAASAVPIISYGLQGEELKIVSMQPDAQGMHVHLCLFGCDYELVIPLVGAFQIYNVLCAVGMSLTQARPEKTDLDRLVDIIKIIKPVKGRMQNVAGHPAGAGVYVDYAHTPDALETVLTAIKPHVKGKLFCVFGCGGDRDKGKRPLMGEVAANHCDTVIITNDNPRNEKDVDIRKQILAPIRKLMHNENVFEIGDRAAAIDFSIQQLSQGDCLVIAGKGHENGQILGDK